MRSLKICLWIAGIGCLLSGFGLFLPISVLESLAKAIGGQPFPDSPLLVYAVRVISATYVGVGVFYVILALDPMKYPVMIPFSGLAAVFLGLVCGITGLAAALPPLWFLGDSLSCLVLGILILIFWQQVGQTSKNE
ncbi:MAG: hypothetical protein ACYS0I_21380 [Planctomycetota bacterium]|jgi:hypothetical protein